MEYTRAVETRRQGGKRP